MSNETNQEITFGDDSSAKSHKRRNRLVRRGLFVCAGITVLTTLAIFWVLFNEATHFFFDRRFTGIVSSLLSGGDVGQRIAFSEFFFGGERWDPTHSINPGYWIVPLVWGTLLITVGAAFVSIPIGTLTALYLSEYASDRVRTYLKPSLEVLAGVPTIVYGFFAISFITPWLIQPLATLFGQQTRTANAIAGAIVVGIMTIPIVASISEDAMNSVPDELRNGAYALGATRYQVSTRIVLPAAVSGVFAGYILAISRAVGETMAVVLAAGFTPQITLNPFDEIQTMTAYMVDAARGEAVIGSIRYQSLFAVGFALFLMTLALNLLNDWVKQRYREEYQ